MQRAVERGLARREQQKPKRIGIDETSYQKRHEYGTVVSDMERGVVIDLTVTHIFLKNTINQSPSKRLVKGFRLFQR